MLGAGMIASSRWGILPGMAAVDSRARIVAICAPSRTHSQIVADDFGIPAVYTSLDEMLDRERLDAVVNITPIGAHFEGSRRILGSGAHLITEKPLASTVEQADELIEMARSRGLLIVCSPPRMIEPQRVRARELVAEGAIGTVAFARVRSSHAGPAWQAWPADPSWFYGADAGPLLDMGAYGIDEITGILGSAHRVSAVSGRLTAERIVHGGPLDGAVVPVLSDDNTLLTLDFGNGSFATVDASFSVRAARSPEIEIFGLDGTIALTNLRLEPDSIPVELYRVAGDGVGGAWEDARGAGFDEKQLRTPALGRASLVQHLVECLDLGETPVLSAEHARHTLEIMLAAQESARTGRTVDLTTRI
ncbi:MAG TPA: Gfo/Idh/MocA family oxidoreductase [Pseudolysinimonas sp.]|jgi:predicted dehydrogenase